VTYQPWFHRSVLSSCQPAEGMEDSALQRMLNIVSKETATGARDYAIMLLMMAYGIRGKSAAALLLEVSTGSVQLFASAHRRAARSHPTIGGGRGRGNHPVSSPSACHSVSGDILDGEGADHSAQQPSISRTIRMYMTKAGVHMKGGGSATLRHSWAIRALAHDSPMKAIADVLGHRCLDTTFIYAKADLKMLQQVAMPWPEGR